MKIVRYPRSFSVLTAFIYAFGLLLLTGAGTAQQPRQTLHDHVNQAVSSGRSALVGSLPSTQNMKISIVLPLRNQDELTNLLSRLYDPSSPDYRKFLSVEQFTERFAPSAEDYQAIVDFVRTNGLTVTDKSENRLIVPISGTVSQIENTFNVKMNIYRHPTESRTFYSPDRDPSLALSVPITHIAGLNNYSIPHPALTNTAAKETLADVIGSGPGGTSYLGSDIRAAYYGGTALTGSGQAVGLFEYGGYNLSDVNLTFSNSGQTYSVPINNVLLDGEDPGPVNGYDAEQVVDIVEAIGMAPGLSQVRVYIGASDVDIFNKMAAENIAKQISISWVWGNNSASDDPIFQEMAAQGQSIFAASGDWGSYPSSSTPLYFPAEDAYVTAVGGTDLTTNGAAGPWLEETAWGPSGGGISPDLIAIPSWQIGLTNTSNGASATLRNIPDVAAEANFDNYLCEAQDGCGAGWGGTSLAAPRWAAFTALANQQATSAGKSTVGFVNPAIYRIGQSSTYNNDIHDVSSGSNGEFNSVGGYDLVTGWGSPAGQNLINALAGAPASSFTLTNSSTLSGLSITPGSSATATITVNDQGGFTGNVTLAVSGLPSGVTASFGTNPASGTSSLKLTASSSLPYETFNVTVTGTSGTLTATTTFAATVLGPGFTLSASPSNIILDQGYVSTSTITINSQNNFAGSVSLVATGLPSGVTASFGANPATGSTVLTLTAGISASTGTYFVTISGTSGATSASTLLSVTIEAQSFELSIPGSNSVTVSEGSSVNATFEVIGLNGFTGNVSLSASDLPAGVTASFNPNPTLGTEYSTLTLTASPTAPLVTNQAVYVTGTAGSLTNTVVYALSIVPGQAPIATTTAISVSPGGGTLLAGAPYIVTATVSPASGSTVPTGNVQFTIGSTFSPIVALNSAGVATYTGIAPAAGNLIVEASYLETPEFLASGSATLDETVVASGVVYISSGGTAVSNYAADQDFTNGTTASTTNAINLAGVVNPGPEAVYQSERNGVFTYTIPGLTAGTSYSVRLHFAEFYWTKAGQRIFNVSINGTPVLSNFDIIATVGAANQALVETFAATANSSGQIVIAFTAGSVDQPKVNGIAIEPITALSIDSGGAATGGFVADEEFVGGGAASTGNAINVTGVAGAAPQAVYQSERDGVFNYVIPGLVAGTNYSVQLHFAEFYWTKAGQRVFNVSINGTPVLTNFDIIATAGAANKALVEQFTATANSDGQIVVSFTNGSADQPKVSGVVVTPANAILSIHAGGGPVGPFVADSDFVNGGAATTANTINVTGVANAAPEAVYQSERTGVFTYTLSGFAAGSLHTVTLHFAEFYWTKAGQRVFNVSINGKPVLTNFDILAAVGANQALVEQFTTTANSSGQIVVSFTAGSADQPKVDGIQVQ